MNEKFAEETLKALRGMDKVPFYPELIFGATSATSSRVKFLPVG